MSSPARATRARRGRVMIVGDLPELSRYTPQLQQPPVMARNLFEALGEVTVATAALPISTILIAENCLRSGAERATESLRKIDPAVRIVLISQRSTTNGAATDWNSKGIDDCVALPLRPEDLVRLFDDELLSAGAAAVEPVLPVAVQVPATSAIPSPRRVNVIEIDSDDSADTSGGENESSAPAEFVPVVEFPKPPRRATAQQAVETHSAPVVAAPAPQQTSAAVSAAIQTPGLDSSGAVTPQVIEFIASESLGDTDLIEAIMSTPQRLRQIAIRLIIQQTQWTDVVLLPNDGAAAEQNSTNSAGARRICVEVGAGGHSFGQLATAMADSRQLQPWADWLARWLLLDHSFTNFRTLSYKCDLTEAWNRRFFDTFLAESIARAGKERRPVTVMVFDIDNFKSYNDHFGHDAGDEVLRETVRLLNSVIRQGDRVCRIGGDEFAVIFADPEAPREAGSAHPETVEVIAKRFQDQICKMRFPKLGSDAPGNLSISAGLATFPWDGHDPEALLRHADQLALHSKRSGKNAINFGPGAKSISGANP